MVRLTRPGLQTGDVITEVEGKAIDGVDGLVAATRLHKVGDVVTITYERNGKTQHRLGDPAGEPQLMFGMSAWHLAVLVLVGLFVFGPERLPDHAARPRQGAAAGAQPRPSRCRTTFKAELGPEVGDLDLRSLHPRTFVEKHLFGDEEDPLGARLPARRRRKPGPGVVRQAANRHRSLRRQRGTPELLRLERLRLEPAAGLNAGLNKVKYDLDAT